MNDTLQRLFDEQHITNQENNAAAQAFDSVDSRFVKDLKLNIGAVLKSQNLNPKETALLAYCIAANEKNIEAMAGFAKTAMLNEATAEELAEMVACASLLSINNVFYRFRHYMKDNAYYNNTAAGIRMSTMMNPVTGKEFFELASLAVSAVNNCEMCIKSHEESVKQHGASEARIYDAIRLAAVVKGFCMMVG